MPLKAPKQGHIVVMARESAGRAFARGASIFAIFAIITSSIKGLFRSSTMLIPSTSSVYSLEVLSTHP
ncbi:hypothetical protein ANO14919_010680 [Xylariales sp. No.14919]|nr:hypothetical protein ANO14919_010680 [Xylariales sp. No.14919]